MAYSPQVLSDLRWGIRVDRAASNLPATATTTFYTISNGRVWIMALVAEVTTVIQAQANAVKWISTPTAGSAVDLCATADINALEVGGKLSLDGTLATALSKTNAGAAPGPGKPVVVAAGNLGFNTAATNTGQIKCSLWWLPFDPGASVAAA